MLFYYSGGYCTIAVCQNDDCVFLYGVMIKEQNCKLFSNVPNGFPVGWVEVRAKHKLTLENESDPKDKGESIQDIGGMLELSGAELNIIGIEGNICCLLWGMISGGSRGI